MEELLIGSLLIWAFGRVLKKKADAPAPGPIAPPLQPRSSQGSPQQMPNPNPQGNPSASASGQIVTGGPQGSGPLPGSGGYNPNSFKKFV